MKKLNLFTKLITPIILVGVAVSYSGYLYLNTIMESAIHHEIDQKIESSIQHTYSTIESEFKLLFYIYGTSEDDYIIEESLTKNEILEYLRELCSTTNDILYIMDREHFINISNITLTENQQQNIRNQNLENIRINTQNYRIKKIYFQPWGWEIVYLMNTSNFEKILMQNKLILLGIVYIVLFLLIVLIVVLFKLYIKNPIDVLLNHFQSITQGKYLHIEKNFNTTEIDRLIYDVNNMTKSIQYREEEAEILLSLTKRSEEYMTDILSSQSSIIIINDTVEILDVNDSFLKFFNQYETLKDFKKVHTCISDYFIKEEGFIYSFEDKNWVEYVLKTQDKVHKIKMLKDEKYYIFTINAKKSEKFERIIITMSNITELEKSVHLLEQYKKAVDAGTIISKTDTKGIITYVNEKFVNISGYTKEELLYHNHNIVSSPRMDRNIFKDMWETIASKKIWDGNIENLRKDGSSYTVAATIVPLLDQNNEILEYIALRYDITEHMEAIERSKKAENAKSLFLANMSHEIRTPLNAIIGFTTILKKSKLEAKEANYINVIDQSAENLLGIVNDVLDISKIENGSLVCESIEFNPFREFNAVFDLFSAKANEKNIELVSTINSKILQTIIGDPLRIKQVLSNLISNAIKFSPEDTKIELDVELISQNKKTCKLLFSVKDYGIGINKAKQKTIFEDFSQADESTSREYGGTGLGLSISNKIVRALGSHIQIESEENEGSRFFFELDYKINVDNNKNLEALDKLKTAIILSPTIKEYDLDHLKIYLGTISNLTLFEDASDFEAITAVDIIFAVEDTMIEDIKKIDEEGSTKIIILSHEKTKCDLFNNAIILNTPYNRSIIFDIMVGFLDNTAIKNNSMKQEYSQYKGKVLIAEDHVINQQLISVLLEFRGVEYTFANNGIEALQLFAKETFDLILMDINMPLKNGKEATSDIIAMEKEKGLNHTPIVALTANAIEADKNETMKIGFDDYLLKPIDENELDKVLTQYLEIQGDDTKKKDIRSSIVLNIEELFTLESAAEKTGLPVVVMKKIVASFIKSIDVDLENLKSSIELNDFDKIKQDAHKIKGASLNLRMENIALLTANIETNAQNNDNSTFQANFKNLLQEVALVKTQVISS